MSLMTPTPDIVSEFAPTGRLRAALNMANPVLAYSRTAKEKPAGVAVDLARESVELHLAVAPAAETYTATLTAADPADGRVLATTTLSGIAGDALVGNLALACNFKI